MIVYIRFQRIVQFYRRQIGIYHKIEVIVDILVIVYQFAYFFRTRTITLFTVLPFF